MYKIDFGDVLTLDDNNEYAVAGIANYQNNKYLYIVDINDVKNIKFAMLRDNMIVELDPKYDCKLIALLLPRFLDSTKKHIKIEFEEK